MLKVEIEKINSIKKRDQKKQTTLVNLSNLQTGPYDWDKLYRKQMKTNYETQFSINQILKDKLFKKKYQLKKQNKKLESIRVNQSNL